LSRHELAPKQLLLPQNQVLHKKLLIYTILRGEMNHEYEKSLDDNSHYNNSIEIDSDALKSQNEDFGLQHSWNKHSNIDEMRALDSVDPLDTLDDLEDFEDDFENEKSDNSFADLKKSAEKYKETAIESSNQDKKQAHSFVQEFEEIDRELKESDLLNANILELDKKMKKRRKQHTASNSSKDEDPDTIEKLKKANQVLKEQLLELNAALDKQLAQKGVILGRQEKRNTQSTEHDVKILLQQISILKKTNEELRTKISTSTDLERITILENKLQSRALKIQKLKEENKSLKNIEREQGKALESYNSEAEKMVNQLKSELNFQKEKTKKIKEAYEKAKLIVEQKSKVLDVTETKYRHLEEIMKQANLTKGGIVESKKLEQELEAKNKELESLEKRLTVEINSKESFKKQSALQISQLKSTIQKLEATVEEVKNQLEEKDKQLRSAVIQLKNGNSKISRMPTVMTPSNNNALSSLSDTANSRKSSASEKPISRKDTQQKGQLSKKTQNDPKSKLYLKMAAKRELGNKLPSSKPVDTESQKQITEETKFSSPIEPKEDVVPEEVEKGDSSFDDDFDQEITEEFTSEDSLMDVK
jgi:myosin heavy subunit